MIYWLLLLSSLSFAQIEHEIGGNLEAQARHAKNNQMAEDDLFQDWEEEQFYLFQGNTEAKIKFKGSRLEANVFGRYAQSPLFDGPLDTTYAASQMYLFPSDLLARDVFKMSHSKVSENSQTDVVLNKFMYEWDYEEHRFIVGRMFINYGLGELFNPINPFNQPTGLSMNSNIVQGNDGFRFTLNVDDHYAVDFFMLGDKQIENYEGQIDRTLWIHGEYGVSPDLTLDYVIGEDQKRQKAGGQVSYHFKEALLYLQGLYQSHLVNKKASTQLYDIALGYDQQLTTKYHLRFEGGYQKQNPYAQTTNFGTRFLPTEYFVALINKYEFHPLASISATLINDIKSGFSYFLTRLTYSVSNSIEAEAFLNTPVGKGDDETEIVAQKLITTDGGIALRTFF